MFSKDVDRELLVPCVTYQKTNCSHNRALVGFLEESFMRVAGALRFKLPNSQLRPHLRASRIRERASS